MISVHVDCLVYYYREVRNITDIRITYYLILTLWPPRHHRSSIKAAVASLRLIVEAKETCLGIY